MNDVDEIIGMLDHLTDSGVSRMKIETSEEDISPRQMRRGESLCHGEAVRPWGGRGIRLKNKIYTCAAVIHGMLQV